VVGKNEKSEAQGKKLKKEGRKKGGGKGGTRK